MENYNYYEAIKEDVINAVTNDYSGYYTEIIKEQLEMGGDSYDVVEALCGAMWSDDSITGSGSGSYWCNAWKAEEAIAHNWDLIHEVASESCMDASSNSFNAEVIDVIIRCHLLGLVLGELADELIEMVEADESAELTETDESAELTEVA